MGRRFCDPIANGSEPQFELMPLEELETRCCCDASVLSPATAIFPPGHLFKAAYPMLNREFTNKRVGRGSGPQILKSSVYFLINRHEWLNLVTLILQAARYLNIFSNPPPSPIRVYLIK